MEDNNEELETIKDKNYMHGVISGVLTAGAAAAIAIMLLSGKYRIVKTDAFEGASAECSTESAEIVDQDMISKLQAIESVVDNLYLFDEDQDLEELKNGIYKGYVDALGDPYSCYYTADEYSKMIESMNGTYEGIGVLVMQDAETMTITVKKVFEGSPAEEAGMLPGDIIVKADDTDVTNMDISKAISHIKGEAGTFVDLQVYRKSENKTVDMKVERREIEVPTVSCNMLDNDIGYIMVSEFESVTAKQYEEAVEKLKAEGMKALIVDLRDNPGGMLDVVNDMLDYMLPEGTIVYTEDKAGNRETYTSDAEHYFDLPLAVLVNENSASASEIFTGAIKAYKKGTIIGTKTFGKGIVQRLVRFDDGSAVKLTVSRYYTPDGVCIHGEGIEPDIEVELDEALKNQTVITSDEDNQLKTAIEYITEQIKN